MIIPQVSQARYLKCGYASEETKKRSAGVSFRCMLEAECYIELIGFFLFSNARIDIMSLTNSLSAFAEHSCGNAMKL